MSTPQTSGTVAHFQSVIKHHKAQHKANLAGWNKDIAAYRGDFWGENTDDETEATVQWPYMYAFVDVLVSNIVPPNPACDIRARRQALSATAEVRSHLVRDVFEKDRLTSKLWRAAAQTSLLRESFLKIVYSKKRQRPRFRVVPPTRIWYDKNAEEWDDIRYLIEAVPLTRAEFLSRCKSKGRGKDAKAKYDMKHREETANLFKAYPSWLETDTKGEDTDIETSRKSYTYAVVYEVYDFVAKKFYHLMEGYDEPLLDGALPFPTQENPYWRISFNDGLFGLLSFSDASMVREPLARLNQLSTMSHEHVMAAMPRPVAVLDRVDNPDELLSAWSKWRGPSELIQAKISSSKYNINDVIQWSQGNPLPIDFVNRMDAMQQLLEFILALPAYSRGQVGRADVATELALVDTAQKTRNARRQKEIYDAIEWAAQSTIRLFGLYLSEKDEEAIYLKMDKGGEKVATLKTLGLETKDGAWDFDYSAHPYNAAEDNSTVQLKKIEAFADLLFGGNPNVDQELVVKELLRALNWSHVFQESKPPPPPGMGPGMGPGMPGNAPASPLDASAPGVPDEMQPILQGGGVGAGGEELAPPLPEASGGAAPALG